MTDSISPEGFKTTRSPATQTPSAMGSGRVIPTGNPSKFEESGDRANALLKKSPNSSKDAKLGDVLSLSMFEAALSLVQDTPADGPIAGSFQKSLWRQLQGNEPKGETIQSLIERMPSEQISPAMSHDLSPTSADQREFNTSLDSDQARSEPDWRSSAKAQHLSSTPISAQDSSSKVSSDAPSSSQERARAPAASADQALLSEAEPSSSQERARAPASSTDQALLSEAEPSSSQERARAPASSTDQALLPEDDASAPLNYDPILTSDTPLPSSDTLVPKSDTLVPTGDTLKSPSDAPALQDGTSAVKNRAPLPENSALAPTDDDSLSATSILVPLSVIPVSAGDRSQSMSDESTQENAPGLTGDDRLLMSDRSGPLSDSHVSTGDEWGSKSSAPIVNSQAFVTNSDDQTSQSADSQPIETFAPASDDQRSKGDHQRSTSDASALKSDAPISANYADVTTSPFADSDLAEKGSAALSTRGAPGSKASILPSSDVLNGLSAQKADDQSSQTPLPNQKVSDDRQPMSSSESASKEEASIDKERSEKKSNERSRRDDLQPALLASGQMEPTAISAVSNTQGATGAERVDAAEQIIAQMVSAVAQIEQLGRTDTVVNLNHPPQFRGVQLVVSEFDSASRELNLTFANVQSPQVQRWLDDPSNAQKLRSGLNEVGFVLQRIETTHEIDSRFFDQSSYQDRGDQSSRQGADQQRSGSDAKGNFAQSEER